MLNNIKHLTDAEKLRHWLDSVPRGEYNNIKRRIVEVCIIPPYTLNNWLHGLCRIPNLAKREINRVTLEVSGIELFTIAKPVKSPKACAENPPARLFNH